MITLDDVEPDRRASVVLDVIRRAETDHAARNRRPAALSAREALAALQFEAVLIWVAAGNLRNGVTLGDDDFRRLTIATARVEAIAREVTP